MSLRGGSIVAGKYRLLERLGSGALGEVWCARNQVIDREVALKLLVPKWTIARDSLERFFATAKSSAKIRHPSIVELLDLGEADHVPYVAMELLEAEKLEIALSRLEALPVGAALRIVAELARALVAAHERQLFHLRIEPANILLHRDSKGVVVPKLVDFGVAQLVADLSASNGPLDDDFLGPLPYLSPEQAREEPPYGAATDVWALGVLLHHACVGSPPHSAATREGLLAALSRPRRSTYETDPSVDKKVSDLVGECLVPEPNLRPTARVLAERAEDLLRRFDDPWRDLGAALEIPRERTIAYLQTLTPPPAGSSSRFPAAPIAQVHEGALPAEAADPDSTPIVPLSVAASLGLDRPPEEEPVSTLIRRSLTDVDGVGNASVLEDLERQLLERLESKRAGVETAPRGSMDDVPPPADGIFGRESVAPPNPLLAARDEPEPPPSERDRTEKQAVREDAGRPTDPPPRSRSNAPIAILIAFAAVAIFAVWVARMQGAPSEPRPAPAPPSPCASPSEWISPSIAPSVAPSGAASIEPSVVPVPTVSGVAVPSSAARSTPIPSTTIPAKTTIVAPPPSTAVGPHVDPFYGVTSSGI